MESKIEKASSNAMQRTAIGSGGVDLARSRAADRHRSVEALLDGNMLGLRVVRQYSRALHHDHEPLPILFSATEVPHLPRVPLVA